MAETRWIFVGSVIAVGLLVTLLARQVGRKNIGGAMAIVAVLLLPQLLIPASSRGWLNLLPFAVVAGVALLAVSGFNPVVWIGIGVIGGLCVLGIGYIGAHVPGGVGSAAIGAYAVMCVCIALGERARLAPLQRAERIAPGDQRYTAMAGRVVGEPIEPPPGVELEGQPVWWRAVIEDTIYAPEALRLRTEHGIAVIDGEKASVDLEPEHSELQTTDDVHGAARALEVLGMRAWARKGETKGDAEPKPDPKADAKANAKADADADAQPANAEPAPAKETGSYTIHWFPADAEIFVLGVPEWERAAPGTSGYRDAPIEPVFRARTGRLHLVDRPIAQARADARFDVFAWTVAAGLFGAASWLHAAGLA